MSTYWLDVPGYVGLYKVISDGAVISVRSGELLSQERMRNGYRRVALHKNGETRRFLVHSLLLTVFVGPRPAGMLACHDDGSRANNRLANLRWDTPKGNSADMVAHGTAPRGERGPRNILSKELAQWVLDSRQSSLELAVVLGVASSTIRAIRIGQNWRHEGLVKAGVTT